MSVEKNSREGAVRATMLPYGQQWIDEADIEEVVNTLKGDFITQGPKIVEFEQAVAKAVGAQYAVAFANGTAALHGACYAAGIGPGDEVITTPLTFAASANCVLYQGGTPVFADVDPQTYLLDIQAVEAKITSKTKAIIPVDFSGQPVDITAFMELARKHNLVIIQDGAHSLGAKINGQPVGAQADMTMFSFHPVKPVTTAEGGVIVTNSSDYYQKLLLFRSHGITKDPELLTHSEGPWYYEMQDLGYNYRMTDLQAALGVGQMGKLSKFIDRRNQLASLYHQELAELEHKGLLVRPTVAEGAQSGWHLYIIQLQLDMFSVGRKEIFEALRQENIGVNVHYIPVYYHPYYQKLGYHREICPVAEKLYESFITLPLFAKMTEADVRDVVMAVKKVTDKFNCKDR